MSNIIERERTCLDCGEKTTTSERYDSTVSFNRRPRRPKKQAIEGAQKCFVNNASALADERSEDSQQRVVGTERGEK